MNIKAVITLSFPKRRSVTTLQLVMPHFLDFKIEKMKINLFVNFEVYKDVLNLELNKSA